MMLFLCAQDLHTFWLGLVNGKSFFVLQEYHGEPEHYSAELDAFLTKQKQIPAQLEGVIVVSGPGSFTASRVSLTIANTLHFACGIPLFVLQNPEKYSPEELLASKGLGMPVESERFARPSYDKPAHITAKRRGDNSLEG